MGTNYYFERVDLNKKWHIGKSSYGWEFHFEAQPELDVYSSTQWIKYIKDGLSQTSWKMYAPTSKYNCRIVNEYDEEVLFEDFMKIVLTEERQKGFDGELTNHFRYLQEVEFKTARDMRLQHGIPVNIKLEEVQPANCWLDNEGYSVSLGEFS